MHFLLTIVLHFTILSPPTVRDTSGMPLKQPWIGGLNNCIFGEIDLNFDGKNDLVVYDQHAEKMLPFVNVGTAANGQNDYRYEPQYASCFPKFSTWFALVDFNTDQLPDLFVFTPPSAISLYQNTSRNGTLKFDLHTPKLKAKIYSDYVDIYSNVADFPTFVDVDGDGNIDLLNFDIPQRGNGLYYYRNHSKNSDSLDFILEDAQWGCFEENTETNSISLNVCDEPTYLSPSLQKPVMSSEANVVRAVETPPDNLASARKHTGSTLRIIDLNSDSLQDLLLADAGYPNIAALYNGGTREKARFTHLDTDFPKSSTPVNVPNCPAISAIDLDNDGVKELIFSPYSGVDFSTEGYASNWVYKNMSNSAMPDYQLVSKRFLQDEMLDFGMGAYPTIVDLNGDGLLDIVVGNYGKIDSAWEEYGTWTSRFVSELNVLKNVGTPTHPEFQCYPLTLSPPLDCAGAVPTFGDIDNDGEPELLIGTESGEIRLYKRTGIPKYELVQENILPENIGTFLSPQLYDLDNDGRLDLIVGDKFKNRRNIKGNITWLRNTGTPEMPEFTKVTDSLGSVDVSNPERSNFGYSKPCFFKDTLGNTHLFCGNEDGKVLHYTNIDENLYGAFTRMPDIAYTQNAITTDISEGMHSAVSVADFNNDGLLDMVVGNHRGGLAFFYGTATPPANTQHTAVVDDGGLMVYPNPVTNGQFTIYNLQFTANSDPLSIIARHSRESGNPPTIEIYDMTGNRVYVAKPNSTSSIVNGTFTVNVSHLPAGTYILKIGNRSAKFIKR